MDIMRQSVCLVVNPITVAKYVLKYIGYVNNYDKNRYLEIIWKADVHANNKCNTKHERE